MKRFFLIVFLLAISPTVTNAQLIDPIAKMVLSADSIMLGDTLTLGVEITKDFAQEISIPTFKENRLTEQIEIVGAPRLDTISEDGRTIVMRVNYTIQSFDAGNYQLDSFPVLIGRKEPFDTLFAAGGDILKVGTFEIDTTKDQPIDIKAIIEAPYSWAEFSSWMADNWWIVAISVVGLGLIGFGVWWYIRRRKAKIEATETIPPHVQAITSLEALRNDKLWQNGRVKEYFSTLTDILRLYIERRYGVAAPEMTSAEIIATLKTLNANDKKLIAQMRELLETADLAKFAKMKPSAEECETVYFDAYYYIEQTKQIEQVEEKEEDAK